MLNLAPVAAAAAAIDYYLARQAGCPIDYYTGAGEAQGEWIGSGADALGLAGELDDESFANLMLGQAPEGGRQLVAPRLRADPRGILPAGPLVDAVRAAAVERGVDAAELFGSDSLVAAWQRDERTADRAARDPVPSDRLGVRADVAGELCAAAGLEPAQVYGERYEAALSFAGKRVDTRLAGIDLCFRPPKSVSLLWGLGSPEIAAQVRAAHRAAGAAALGWLEEVAGYARRGHSGDGRSCRKEATDGLIAAGFEHRSSRAGDPLLHTHYVVANLVHGRDGNWSALDSRALYRHAKTAGYLYQRGLRAELGARLGLEWSPVRNGTAELAGVAPELITAFSKRRTEILERMAEHGGSGAKAAQIATLATRPAKERLASEHELSDRDPGSVPLRLQERWRTEAAELGVDAREFGELVGRGVPGLTAAGRDFAAAIGLEPRSWHGGLTPATPAPSRRRSAVGCLAQQRWASCSSRRHSKSTGSCSAPLA